MTKFITQLINWMLYTSFFAACCAVGLCMATERLLIGEVPPLLSSLHLLVYGSTLLVYNVHYLVKPSYPELSDKFAWSQHYKFWHYGGLLTGIACCAYGVLTLPLAIFYACVVLGLLSFAYSLPLLPFKDKKRLKDFGWVKILVLTSVWTIVTSILPMLYWDKPIQQYPFEILLRFVFMFTLCVAFDIRDMQTDKDANIYTLPNIIGLQNSYRLMDAALVLFALLSVVQYLRYPFAGRLIAELLSAVVTAAVIRYSKTHSSDKVYLGFVDGMMLLYALLVLWQ